MNQKIIAEDYGKNFHSKRKIQQEKLDFGINSTFLMLLGVIAVLVLYYVWTLNVTATQGYTLRQMEIKWKEIMMESERLEVKLAELQSLSTIMTEEDNQNMEKIEEADFLVIKDDVQYVYSGK